MQKSQNRTESRNQPLQQKPARRNGFTPPYDLNQFLAWITLLLISITTFAFYIPAYLTNQQYYLFPFFGVTTVSTFLLIIVITYKNGADKAVHFEKNKLLPNFTKTKDRPHVINTESYFCYICQVNVHPTSRHCRLCNKCTVGFDHHCKYLNTCIGSRNYKLFLVTLVSAMLSASFSFALGFYVVYQAIFIDVHNLNQAVITGDNTCLNPETWWRFDVENHSYGKSGWEVVVGYLCFILLLTAAALASIIHLFGFHMMLIKNNTTTYNYIIAKREEKENKKKQNETNKNTNQNNSTRMDHNINKKSRIKTAKSERSTFTNFSITDNAQCFALCCGSLGPARIRKPGGRSKLQVHPSTSDINMIYDGKFSNGTNMAFQNFQGQQKIEEVTQESIEK